MKLIPLKCIKCQCDIMKSGNNVIGNYNEIEFENSHGERLTVGICDKCTLEDSELPAVVDALIDYFKESFQLAYDQSDLKIVKRNSYVEVLKRIQNNLCAVCGLALGSTHKVTNGIICHERCWVNV